jgi:hypothetical protein
VVQERGREAQRLQKLLEDAGIKLDSVASDIQGLSCRRMIEALIAGEPDPEVLADMALTRVRPKIPELQEALEPSGPVGQPARGSRARRPSPRRRLRSARPCRRSTRASARPPMRSSRVAEPQPTVTVPALVTSAWTQAIGSCKFLTRLGASPEAV